MAFVNKIISLYFKNEINNVALKLSIFTIHNIWLKIVYRGKKSFVLEPGTSKISIRTSKDFHPMSDWQVKKYSGRLYFLESPALFGNRTSKKLGVHRTSRHFKKFLPLVYYSTITSFQLKLVGCVLRHQQQVI